MLKQGLDRLILEAIDRQGRVYADDLPGVDSETFREVVEALILGGLITDEAGEARLTEAGRVRLGQDE